ncbi:(Fe-S)-binding protein [Clostridium folliculivorans]|uniref:(Fe-S)-binding protein n=1 Tax=Clostridium folliculivorans TaxID=2886038 RepID=A0A9W5Y680_9CLOT|nr:epoxyqueuosine reductase [Clostridium folliculivorans]GKU27504.1 (Fe-S)-binding protein [Clostridium folliculivorans]
MKNQLEKLIREFIKKYQEDNDIESGWKEPLISYADASDKRFYKLKEIVSPSHAMPQDFLPGAKTVVSYFIPFEDFIVESNIEGRISSKIWARAYIETNKLIFDLNSYIKNELEKLGYKSNIIPATHNFDTTKLISDWSHRHVAYISGLGTFGLNNMLITEKGCCGRVGSFVTDLELEPSNIKEGENCLYKRNNVCKKCVARCVNAALKVESFNRHKCYEMCLSNAEVHSEIELSDVCGKCLVNLPCSTTNPVKLIDK